MPWTKFYDVHSEGFPKEKWEECYIEACGKEAISIFYARYGHSPLRVSCTCCGPDYIIYEVEMEDVPCPDESHRVIFEREILPKERKARVPKQGYVWVD